MDLNKFREEINQIDGELLGLLARRRLVARRVIQTKHEKDLPLRDVSREEDLLDALIQRGRELQLDAHFVTSVFHEIIDDSVRSQQLFLQGSLNGDAPAEIRVAFQGVEGAYSHLAAQKQFAADIERTSFIGCVTFAEVAELVEEGGAEYGLLPVENTTAGSINEVYDVLSRTKLSIVGEEIFRVQHCLLAIEDVPLSNIRRIYSHPQALAQCKNFLSELRHCQREYFADTAMAVKKVRDDRDLSQAAIASEQAGKLYGLKVIQRKIADQNDNFTRFLLVAPKPIRVDPRVPSKTSLILATADHEGALLQALSVLHAHRINCTKLESRPKLGSPFDYLFYLDFEGSIDQPHVAQALTELRAATSFLKVLGSYPRQRRERTRPRPTSLAAEATEAPADADEGAPTGAGEQQPTPAPTGAADEAADAAFRHASRARKSTDTVVRVKDVQIGGGELVIIAGPAVVTSQEQILACARQVRESGARVLCGGCFRPGGAALGMSGVELLAKAARDYGLAVMTEVVAPDEVERVAAKVDLLRVDARHMHNTSLLVEVGRTNRPVLLERSATASIEELLQAAETILNEGNQQVVLCERGVRTFETTTRSSLDLGAVRALARLSHLPVLVDPTQAADHRELVAPLALAARELRPAGIVLEISADESGSPSALDFASFAQLTARLFR